jgi:hypothetical protein
MLAIGNFFVVEGTPKKMLLQRFQSSLHNWHTPCCTNCEPRRTGGAQCSGREFHVAGFTRLFAFVSLITVVAAVTAGGWDAALEPVAAAPQVANVAA